MAITWVTKNELNPLNLTLIFPALNCSRLALRSAGFRSPMKKFKNSKKFQIKKKYTVKSRVLDNMSRLEAHAGFFRLLMKGIFDLYEL